MFDHLRDFRRFVRFKNAEIHVNNIFIVEELLNHLFKINSGVIENVNK